MCNLILKRFCQLLCWVLISFTSAQVNAGVVPANSIILSLGTGFISMRAMKDSAVRGVSISAPGFYLKVSGENYKNDKKFIHVSLNMSLNHGTMENGTVKESRLCFNYGFGRVYKRIKLLLSPGFCFSSIGYQNNTINKSVDEMRFAPSLGLQTELILVKSRYRYLAVFVEGSAMIAKPARWVQQLAMGLSWKPSFRKEAKPILLPY